MKEQIFYFLRTHVIHFVKLELERVLPQLRVEERGQPLRDGGILGVISLEDGAGDAVTSEDKQTDSLTRAHQGGGRVISVEDNEALLASDILRHFIENNSEKMI